MYDKLILSDCDGALLDWEWAFHVWMQERGYILKDDAKLHYNVYDMFHNLESSYSSQLIKTFNESAAIGFLPALRDSVYYVKLLHELHGYRFRIITSMSKDVNAQKLRDMNLRKLFGNAIEDILFLDTGADKDSILEPYRDSGLYWIEDKPENADVGHTMGLKSILMEHGHNMNHSCSYPIVASWREIYNIIIGE